jgi:hypothetical protein
MYYLRETYKTTAFAPHPIPITLPSGEKVNRLLPLPLGERIEVRGCFEHLIFEFCLSFRF